MNYFSRRNKHIVEFSGYEEASPALRQRLIMILQKYVGENISFGDGAQWYVDKKNFLHEVRKEFPGQDPISLVRDGVFHGAFTVVEIFLDMTAEIYHTRQVGAPLEVAEAFDLSGSVYKINDYRIELKVDEKLAKRMEEVKNILPVNSSAYDKFFEGLGNLVGRKAKAEDVVKDLFIGFEDYLKEKTGAKDYGAALSVLEKDSIISATQKSLLEKIYAYRSDTYGVGHAGNGDEPEEIDALWFADTVTAQILLIDRKLKKTK